MLRTRHARGMIGDVPQLGDYRRKRDPPRTPEPFGGARRAAAPVRRPAPRRTAAPLRPAARAGRRARELGRAEGRCRSRPASGTSRSTSRIIRSTTASFEGDDPGRRVRRRHGRDLGPRDVRAARGEARRRPHLPAPRGAGRRRLDARPRAARRERAELAPPAEGRAAPRRPSRRARSSRPSPRSCRRGAGLAVRAEVGRIPGDRDAPRAARRR